MPPQGAYQKIEKISYDESYENFKLRYDQNERIKNNLYQRIHENRLNERNNRIQMNNTMYSHIIGLIDCIKKDYKEKHNKELDDDIAYTLLLMIKDRFSLDEESEFAQSLEFYESFDKYLEARLHSQEDWGYRKILSENYVYNTHSQDINKETFETLRESISHYISYLVLPEVKQLYGKMNFSRIKTSEYFSRQEKTSRDISEEVIGKLQEFFN